MCKGTKGKLTLFYFLNLLERTCADTRVTGGRKQKHPPLFILSEFGAHTFMLSMFFKLLGLGFVLRSWPCRGPSSATPGQGLVQLIVFYFIWIVLGHVRLPLGMIH